MFALSVTVYEIFTVEMRTTLTLTFRMDQGQMQICQWKDPSDFRCWHSQCLPYPSAFARYSQSKCARLWPWQCPWPLELAKVKYKWANSKSLIRLSIFGKGNVCPTFHRLRDNHVFTSKYTRFETLALKVKAKGADDRTKIGFQKVSCRHAYVRKKMALLDPAFFRSTKSYISWHTHARTSILRARITPFQHEESDFMWNFQI